MLKRFTLASLLAVAAFSAAARADDDSASDAPNGFVAALHETRGVVVRVPVNADGAENTSAAELRFYRGDADVGRNTDPRALWGASTDLGRTREVLGLNIPRDPNGDTPTCAPAYWGYAYGYYGCGWNNWYGWGWAPAYYYQSWYPTFYWSGAYWNYQYQWWWGWGWYRYYYYVPYLW
jgi:hypothetical protein